MNNNFENIRKKEIEESKNYSMRKLKTTLAIFIILQFFVSRTFFFFIWILSIFIPMNLLNPEVDFYSKVLITLILHFLCFTFVEPLISKITGIDENRKEIPVLINVYKEIIEQRKRKY